MRGSAVAVAALVLFLGSESVAAQIYVTGVVTSVDPGLSGGLSSLGITVGTPYSATIVLDTTRPDSQSDPTVGAYQNAVTSLVLSAGSFVGVFAAPPDCCSSYVQVGLNPPPSLSVWQASTVEDEGIPIAGSVILLMNVELQGAGFTSDSMVPPSSTSWSPLSNLDLIGDHGNHVFRGNVATVVVPEPVALAGIAPGLVAALFLVRTRGRRR